MIEAIAKNAQDPFAGNLTLGAFPTLAPYILPRLIPCIKDKLPKLRLILIEEKTEHLITQLKEGRIDVALLAAPINDDTLMTEQLFDDEFMLAVAPSHPLANKSSVSAADLVNQPLLLLDEGHCLRDQALQFCQISGVKEEQNLRATSLETLRQMVIAGTGITFIPNIAIQDGIGSIHYIPFETPQPKRRICLVWRKTNPRTKLMSELKRIIINSYK